MDKVISTLHAGVHWLEGKKALWLAIGTPIISFLVTEGTITASTGTLLNTILSVVCGGAIALGRTEKYRAYKLGKQ